MNERKSQYLMFVCGAKDFHAMDKFSLVHRKLGSERVFLVTDTMKGEGQDSRIRIDFNVKKMFIIDPLIINSRNQIADLWRNVIKFLLIPFQALMLRRIYNDQLPDVVHAVPMYYMLLCKVAQIPYIGTPQAGEVLIRPKSSRIYKFFSKIALNGARKIIVDSNAMRNELSSNFNVGSLIIKNGFSTRNALTAQARCQSREFVTSVRAIRCEYRIGDLVDARNYSNKSIPIDFAFPSIESAYFDSLKNKLCSNDRLHGSLEKPQFYTLLAKSILVISIPSSDSSPRSVYESIFCGAAVAISQMSYYYELPICMRERIVIVDLNDANWFELAYNFALAKVKTPYIPSTEAMRFCDEDLLINNVISNVYNMDVL